jgi:hypothetical protein
MCIPRKTDLKFSSLLPGQLLLVGAASLPSWVASASAAPSRTALAICGPVFAGLLRSFPIEFLTCTPDLVNYSCCLIQPSQIELSPLPAKSSKSPQISCGFKQIEKE